MNFAICLLHVRFQNTALLVPPTSLCQATYRPTLKWLAAVFWPRPR